MPLAESNYPFFELAFDKFETMKKKMTEKNKHELFMTSPPSLCRYHINNGVRGGWAAWIFKMRVQGDCKRGHDQEVALTSHPFTRAPVTYVSWQNSPWELPGHFGSLKLWALRAQHCWVLGSTKQGTAILRTHLQMHPSWRLDFLRGLLAACPS